MGIVREVMKDDGIWEFQVTNGRKNGFFRLIKKDGACKMGFYKNGKCDEFVQYNANGTIVSSEEDKKDEK